MNKQLPERPDLGQLKKRAKELLDEVHAGAAEALARVAGDGVAAADFALHDAQRVVAREHGFASWAKLKLHVETRQIEEAETRLVRAALHGENDVVADILAERPGLATRRAWTAAALGERQAVLAALRDDPEFAARRDGPGNWEPLLYVCFGRCGGGDADRAAIAKALLAAGAQADASFVEAAWPESPQTALYGATGVNDYPQLARVLLEAGADPNDCESRYHAAEHHHVRCLEVLAEFGCDFSGADKVWGNTPLYFLFGHAHAAEAKAGIRWLLEHGANPNVASYRNGVRETPLHAAVNHDWDVGAVELLLRHGADIEARRADGRTAYALAVRGGKAALAQALRERGAADEASESDRLLGVCMRGEAVAVREIAWSDEDRKMPLVAAREGRAAALRTLAEMGMSLEVSAESGERPLHWAAWHGWRQATAVLIEHQVALSECDRRFGAPPSGWCAHGSVFCANPKGEYAAVMEMLIAAGAFVAPETSGSAEVMAVLRRHGIGRPRSG